MLRRLALGCLLALAPLSASAEDSVANVVTGQDDFSVRANRTLFENRSLSPRARALGGSFVALSNGAAGLIENPASLGAQTDREALFNFGWDQLEKGAQSADLITIDAGGAVNLNACAPEYMPRDCFGNQTAGFLFRHNGMDFNNAGDLSSSLDGVVFGYGRSLRNGRVFWGIAGGIYEGDYSDDGHLVDQNLSRMEVKTGLIVRASDRLALGGMLLLSTADLDNRGSAYLRYDGDVWQNEIRLGAAYELAACTLMTADVSHSWIDTDYKNQDSRNAEEDHGIWRVGGGLEHILIEDRLTVRAGAYFLRDAYDRMWPGEGTSRELDSYIGVTGGASLYVDDFEIGYTLDLRDTGEMGNFINIGYAW